MTSSTAQRVVTRIAPSPTGLFHIGTARTALFNYLFARKHGGTFLVRIEDTDKARSTQEFERDILDGLHWLGLTHDEPVRQSERAGLYEDALRSLVAKDLAYVSREPAKDDPSREVEVVRLRNKGGQVSFHDVVRGDITFDTTELGDFVIARSLTDALYHFAVVVDDALMGVTHIIRGDDHISNTPRQILIQEALGYERPTYAHLPLILAKDRSKLSKRKGAVSVSSYREDGFLPEAIVNYLALLGWNPGTDEELFTLNELCERFELGGLQKSGAVFDIEKLKWFNKEHRKRLPPSVLERELEKAIEERPAIAEALARSPSAREDMMERFATTRDLRDAIERGEYSYLEQRPVLVQEKLVWKKDAAPERLRDRLTEVRARVEGVLETNFTYAELEAVLMPYADTEGRGNVLWPVRYALSGMERSPDPFVLFEALGKDESLARLSAACTLL